MKVVVDTNVLVSGLFGIKDSPSSQILSAFRNRKIILATSPLIIEEVADVINRPRIIKLTKMSGDERIDFINKLIERSEVTAGKEYPQIARDAKDDKFLFCAIEAKEDYIVTGDKDLLTLKEYEEIRVITPRKFLKILI